MNNNRKLKDNFMPNVLMSANLIYCKVETLEY